MSSCACYPGYVCKKCVLSFQRVCMQPRPERVDALKRFYEKQWEVLLVDLLSRQKEKYLDELLKSGPASVTFLTEYPGAVVPPGWDSIFMTVNLSRRFVNSDLVWDDEAVRQTLTFGVGERHQVVIPWPAILCIQTAKHERRRDWAPPEPPPEEEEETPGLELPSGPPQLRLVKE